MSKTKTRTRNDDLAAGYDQRAEVRGYYEEQRSKTKRATVGPIDQIITASLANAGMVREVGMMQGGIPVEWLHRYRSVLNDAFGLPTLGHDSDDQRVTSKRGHADPTARRALAILEPIPHTRAEVFGDLMEYEAERIRRSLAYVTEDGAVDIEAAARAIEIGMLDSVALVRKYGLGFSLTPANAMQRYDDEVHRSTPLTVRAKRPLDHDNGAVLFLSSDVDDAFDEETGQWYSPEMRATINDEVDDGLAPIVQRTWREHLITDHGLEPKPDDDDPTTLARRRNWHLAKRFAMAECLDSCQCEWE